MNVQRGIKQQKTAPASANKKKLFEGDGFVVFWKGRATPRRRYAMKAAPPKPKPWAALVVWMKDGTKRKRSYHVAWNGTRFNDTSETTLLWEREPEVFTTVQVRLPAFNEKLIKHKKCASYDDGWT